VIELNCYTTEDMYMQDKTNNTTENKLYYDTSLNFIPDNTDGAENWVKQAYKCQELLGKFPNKIDILDRGQVF
jgi:hypothetical protein